MSSRAITQLLGMLAVALGTAGCGGVSAVKSARVPGSGSPDMGGVSADGKLLWLTGHYDREVYRISKASGRLSHRINVGDGPHGLSVWLQPGLYSVGHTGILR